MIEYSPWRQNMISSASISDRFFFFVMKWSPKPFHSCLPSRFHGSKAGRNVMMTKHSATTDNRMLPFRHLWCWVILLLAKVNLWYAGEWIRSTSWNRIGVVKVKRFELWQCWIRCQTQENVVVIEYRGLSRVLMKSVSITFILGINMAGAVSTAVFFIWLWREHMRGTSLPCGIMPWLCHAWAWGLLSQYVILYRPVVFNLSCSRTPRCNFSSTL
jgi:hypothetical protein